MTKYPRDADGMTRGSLTHPTKSHRAGDPIADRGAKPDLSYIERGESRQSAVAESRIARNSQPVRGEKTHKPLAKRPGQVQESQRTNATPRSS